MSSNNQVSTSLLLQLRRLSTNAVMYSHTTAAVAKLNPTDMECLELLTLHGPLSAGSLSRLTGLTSGATTTMIDRLEQAGYVHREPGEFDRRQVRVMPNTQKIDTDLDHISAPLGAAMLALIAAYPAADVQLIHAFLLKANTIVEGEIERLAARM